MSINIRLSSCRLNVEKRQIKFFSLKSFLKFFSLQLSGFVQYFVDCCIDRIGSPLDDLEPREYLGWSIPLYVIMMTSTSDSLLICFRYTRDFLQSLPVANVTTELAMKG